MGDSPTQAPGPSMPTYDYTAMDKSGQQLHGVLDGSSEQAAAAELRERGLFVTHLCEQGSEFSPDDTIIAEYIDSEAISEILNDAEAELIQLTRTLVESVDTQDWNTYARLCDQSLTAFEPEARGQLVEGMDFHEFYFGLTGGAKRKSSVCSPKVRLMSDSAIVTYARLVQITDTAGPRTAVFEETRIWQHINGTWQHVHFHRSAPAT